MLPTAGEIYAFMKEKLTIMIQHVKFMKNSLLSSEEMHDELILPDFLEANCIYYNKGRSNVILLFLNSFKLNSTLICISNNFCVFNYIYNHIFLHVYHHESFDQCIAFLPYFLHHL